jgi:hypothetical protein
MTKRNKAELGEFIARLKKSMTDLRQSAALLLDGFRDDPARARRTRDGVSAADRPVPGTAPTVLKVSFRGEEPTGEARPKGKNKKTTVSTHERPWIQIPILPVENGCPTWIRTIILAVFFVLHGCLSLLICALTYT